MKIAIAGGTGLIGRMITEDAAQRGHETVVLARSRGVDLLTGEGADAALDGVDAVIDVVNTTSLKADEATAFFTTATGTLASAAARAGVGNLVLLSIVGVDRIPYDYYAGKLAQERTLESSAAEWTILRATQFHEFSSQLFAGARLGPLHVAPRGRTQPIAAHEVAAHLVSLAEAPAAGRATDIGGPREEALDDMLRRYARRIGHRGWIPSLNAPGRQMKGMREGLALPGPEAILGRQTFDEWLAELPG